MTWWARFVAAQAVILFALLEIVLRVYQPVAFRVRGDEIILPVNQTYRFDNRAATKLDPVTVHTKNILGFRGPDPPRDFDRRLTIVAIGGSTTECLFLSDGKTWTDALARGLQRLVPDVWVNNAGIDGQSTFGHLVLLRAAIVPLRPDVAVFLLGANDVGLERSNTFDLGTLPSGGGLRAVQNAIVRHSEVASLALNLARARRARDRGFGHSEIDLRTARRLYLEPATIDATVRKYEAFLPGYADRLREIAALTRASGIAPVWVTQPALFGDGVDPATGVELSGVQVSGRGNGHLEWRLLELYNDATRRVAAQERVPLIDLARELPKDSRDFYDFLHFTNEGAARVGDIVAARLAPHLRTVPTSDPR